MDSFWTFVVEMLIFTVGGIAVYEGIEKLRHSQPLGHVPLILGVLALSFAFEALAFLASWRESERGRPELSRRRHRRVSLVQFIHFSPQPGVFEVLDEVGLGHHRRHRHRRLWGWADGAAALPIGVLLIVLAGVILAESESLLTGEAVPSVILDGVRDILASDSLVSNIEELWGMYLGLDEILLVATLDFKDGTTAHQVKEACERVMAQLRRVGHVSQNSSCVRTETSMCNDYAGEIQAGRRAIRRNGGDIVCSERMV